MTISLGGTSARDVSIHAPRFREAMPHTAIAAFDRLQVSIHAPRFREAMRMG